MNVDNRRLNEIKYELHLYYKLLGNAESVYDCILIQNNINRLEAERDDILGRCDLCC